MHSSRIRIARSLPYGGGPVGSRGLCRGRGSLFRGSLSGGSLFRVGGSRSEGSSNWKNPPLAKTLPFTGAQILCLEISNSEGGAKKNGYYDSVP